MQRLATLLLVLRVVTWKCGKLILILHLPLKLLSSLPLKLRLHLFCMLPLKLTSSLVVKQLLKLFLILPQVFKVPLKLPLQLPLFSTFLVPLEQRCPPMCASASGWLRQRHK